MLKGTTGKILRVDLTRKTITTEQIDEAFYRLYPGGKALAAYYLLRELPKGIDALSPDNILILANGLLTGAPFSTATRFTAIAKSPLSRGFGESEAAGYWGPELKMAGWEAIIIKGRAESPVYLWVHNDQAEICDARDLWGQDPELVQNKIRETHNDKLIRVLQIGIAGENLVRYASLTNDLRHFNGRNGMGAVMGSKNLRAVAVRGHSKYVDLAHNPQPIAELGRTLAKRVKEHPQSWDLQDKGTPGLVDGLNAAGILPTRNFHQGAFENVDKIKWAEYESKLLTARKSCYACAVRCKREVKVDDRYQVSDAYGGPEYETLDSFGPNCGIDDLQAIAKANELCNRYGLDSISCGSTIAFAMECFEHELIGLKDTGGIALRFGNASAMVKLVELIAKRQGIGDLLAEGTQRAAELIGGDAKFFAMHVKGQELPMHDPRGKVGVGIGYAINDAGADHLVSIHDPMISNPESVGFKGAAVLGIEATPSREISSRKARNFFIVENWNSMEKVTGLCFFGPAPRSFIQVDEVVNAIRAATGWQVTLQDVLKIGERAANMARAFNIREGFTRADDKLPERLFQPLENGALQGVAISKPDFEQMLDELYRLKDWDAQTGSPSRAKLRELEIEWVADLIGV
jgi:aldehyde:ferredoxin oxidoreductase